MQAFTSATRSPCRPYNPGALPREIPTLQKLNLPKSLSRLVQQTHGLVLVCGPTGSGKSSTLAALVGEINQRRATARGK